MQQAAGAYRGWRTRQDVPRHAGPESWRFGTRPVARLARCARLASAVLPPGSRVLFHTARHDFFEWRWASFLFFEHDLLLDVPPGARPPDFAVVFDAPRPAGLTPLREGGACAVYRLR